MQPRSCPLYTVEEINAFERTFLTLIDYKVIVTGRQSAGLSRSMPPG